VNFIFRKTRRSPEPLPHCGFGDLKDPSFPPVAQGHSPRDLGGDESVAATGTTFPLIPIVRVQGSSFQKKCGRFSEYPLARIRELFVSGGSYFMPQISSELRRIRSVAHQIPAYSKPCR